MLSFYEIQKGGVDKKFIWSFCFIQNTLHKFSIFFFFWSSAFLLLWKKSYDILLGFVFYEMHEWNEVRKARAVILIGLCLWWFQLQDKWLSSLVIQLRPKQKEIIILFYFFSFLHHFHFLHRNLPLRIHYPFKRV